MKKLQNSTWKGAVSLWQVDFCYLFFNTIHLKYVTHVTVYGKTSHG